LRDGALLSVAHSKLADMFLNSGAPTRGDLVEATQHLIAGRAIIAQLVEHHPDQPEWKRLLVYFEERLALIG
jgi:hypothetical protein